MKLEESIKIVFFQDTERYERVCLNSGVEVPGDKNQYRESVLIPNWDWRIPNEIERKQICANNSIQSHEWDISSCIGVVKVPEEALSPFYNLGIDSINTISDYETLISNSSYKKAISEAGEFF